MLSAQKPSDFNIAIAANRMNVLFAGVDNPLTIAVNSHPFSDLEISSDPAISLTRMNERGDYMAHVLDVSSGSAKIRARSKKTGALIAEYSFRLKRIPDPVAKIQNRTGGSFSSGEMQAQMGIIAVLEGFDMEARCEITSFTCYYTPVRGQVEEHKQMGGRFAGDVLAAVKRARVGDQYQFVDIKARCPGDRAGRSINSIAIVIK